MTTTKPSGLRRSLAVLLFVAAPLVAAEYEQVFADSTLVAIPDAGHAVSSQAPPEYLEALASFLVAT